jgi:putative transposase
LKVAKLHEKAANQRKNFLHHQSKELGITYDAVIIENLHMKGMSQALHFGQSVHDNSWGVTRFLEYKLKEQGKHLIKIDRWFPSMKTCACCDKEHEMPLSERVYQCSCGLVLKSCADEIQFFSRIHIAKSLI